MENAQLDTQEEEPSEKPPRFPIRWNVAVLMFLGTTCTIIMRANMSVAVVSMTNETGGHVGILPDNVSTCREFLPHGQNQTARPGQQDEYPRIVFNWSGRTEGVILSSFYYGWTISTFLSCIVVQRFGAMWPYGLSILFSAVCTILTPVAAQWHVASLILIRATMGVAQGVIAPARNVLVSNWTPLTERGRVYTFVMSGMDAGVAISMLGTGMIAHTHILGGWPLAFYVFGAVAILWFLLFAALVYEKPSLHPRISAAELKALERPNRSGTIIPVGRIPWKAIFSSVPVWAMVISVFGQFWGYSMVMSQLPTYLANILHFNIKTNGLLSALPYFARFASGFISGPTSDKLLQSGRFTISTVRKISNTIGLFGSGSCILVVAFIGCQLVSFLALICLAMFISSFTSSGSCLATIDMSPAYTGILSSMCYTFGGVAAILTPLVAGEIIQNEQTLENWKYIFICTAAVMFPLD